MNFQGCFFGVFMGGMGLMGSMGGMGAEIRKISSEQKKICSTLFKISSEIKKICSELFYLTSEVFFRNAKLYAKTGL